MALPAGVSRRQVIIQMVSGPGPAFLWPRRVHWISDRTPARRCNRRRSAWGCSSPLRWHVQPAHECPL